MRLTSFTDYTLRTLLHLGSNRDRLVTIQEIADLHSISKNHLMKVVNELARNGVVETIRGRNGGFECFDPAGTPCGLVQACRLKGVLGSATKAYLDELDRHTLASLLPEPAPRETPVAFHRKKAA